MGPAHRVDVITALRAMTIWPAWRHFENDEKGSIEPAKLADLVMLSADPTAVDPETLDALRIGETVKEGETVFALNEAEMRRGGPMIAPGGAAEQSFAATMREIAVARDLGPSPGGPALRAARRASVAARRRLRRGAGRLPRGSAAPATGARKPARRLAHGVAHRAKTLLDGA